VVKGKITKDDNDVQISKKNVLLFKTGIQHRFNKKLKGILWELNASIN